MISNIFGLHLGCNVKDVETGEIGCLKGIISHEEMTGGFYLVCGENTVPVAYCKLLLKPLSAMSDEDKREFEKEFGCEEKVIRFEIYNEKTVLVCFEFTDFDGDPMDRWDDMSLNEMLWLCSKGYDVGLVPDEYKEIVK